MKIYDISQEVFSSRGFPGDPSPERRVLCDMDRGDLYNLTAFSMCAHNGTHVDAPYHFIYEGKRVDEISLSATVGWAYVAEFDGTLTAEDARGMLARAASLHPEAAYRILIKGDAVVSEQAAEVFAGFGVLLVGNESQTVGPENAPLSVHKILLGADAVLLEGIRLKDVDEGVYLLSAPPLALGGADCAPVRAILIDMNAESF